MNLCKDCKYIHIDSSSKGAWRTNYCRKDIRGINVVTGDLDYGQCEYKNKDGNCKDWEPNFWYKVFRR